MTAKERILAAARGAASTPAAVPQPAVPAPPIAPPIPEKPVAATASTPFAIALPYIEAGQGAPLPVRFALLSRAGAYWSYPYGYVGLVECPTPELLVIHCESTEVQSIEVRGRRLDDVANLLTSQRLVLLRESDHPAYPADTPIVGDIVINRAGKSSRTMGA